MRPSDDESAACSDPEFEILPATQYLKLDIRVMSR